jgi:hypothetical protein
MDLRGLGRSAPLARVIGPVIGAIGTPKFDSLLLAMTDLYGGQWGKHSDRQETDIAAG